MIENALAEALAIGEPVGSGEIYAGLPRRGGSGGVLAPGGNQSHDRSCREVAAN